MNRGCDEPMRDRYEAATTTVRASSGQVENKKTRDGEIKALCQAGKFPCRSGMGLFSVFVGISASFFNHSFGFLNFLHSYSGSKMCWLQWKLLIRPFWLRIEEAHATPQHGAPLQMR